MSGLPGWRSLGFGLVCLAIASSGFCAPTPTESLPPLIYTLTVKSETVDSWSGGLVTDAVGALYRNSHKQFLTALEAATAERNAAESYLRPLACAGAECRRVIQESNTTSADWLKGRLATEPTRAALVANITIIFDGRFFQVPTTLSAVRLTERDEVVVDQTLGVTYIKTYSVSQHAEDIATGRNDTPFDGLPGHKRARAHYWLGGARPRLIEELNRSIEMIAEMWQARTSPESAAQISAAVADRASLPTARDVIGKASATCKTFHPEFRVLKNLGGYFWLLAPYAQQYFFIVPQCGFDY